MDAFAHSAVTKAAAPSIGQSLLPLLILAISICAGFTTMVSFGIMTESAKAELGLSDTAIGLIQGVSAALPLVLFSIPIGALVDRINRVKLMILFAITWTAGTFLTAVADTAWPLFVARMLTGIGTTGALTAALSLSADLCLPEQRGRGLLITTLGKSLGQAAAFALSGWLIGMFAAAHGPRWFGDMTAWRSAQMTLGVLSAICVLPLFFVREPERHEVEAGPDAPFKVVFGELWSRRAFLIPLFIGQTSVVMADAAAGIWAAPVIERNYGLKPEEFGAMLGGTILLTGILGAILGGIVADSGQKTGRRGGLLIGAIVAAIIGIPTALFPLMPDATTNILMLGALVLAGTVTGLVTSVALTVFLPNELRGLSIGAFIAIAGLIGFGITPPLVAGVSSLLGGERHLATALAVVGVAVSIISVWGFWIAMKRTPETLTCQKGMD